MIKIDKGMVVFKGNVDDLFTETVLVADGFFESYKKEENPSIPVNKLIDFMISYLEGLKVSEFGLTIAPDHEGGI
jgi:hypothetical protein